MLTSPGSRRSRAARICCWRWARVWRSRRKWASTPPWRSISASASWLGTLVERVDINCSRCTRSAWRPATTQPTRKPGARHFEKELHSRLSPRVSQYLMGLGRSRPK